MKNDKAYIKLLNIQIEVIATYNALLALFGKEYSGADQTTGYLEINIIECMLNNLKALEYHYRDNGANGRVKAHYPTQLKNALKVLKKYAENAEHGNPYSNLILKEKFDLTGVVKQKNKTRKK